MPRKVYVAGSTGETHRAKAAMLFLDAAGFTITHDWTEDAEAEGVNGGSGKPTFAKPDQCAGWAQEDLDAIDTASIVLFLGTNTFPARGMHVELGYALARGKTVIWAGAQPSIFNYLYDVYCASDKEALRYMVNEYGGGRLAAGEVRP